MAGTLTNHQTDLMKMAYGWNSNKRGYRKYLLAPVEDQEMKDLVERGFFEPPTDLTVGPIQFGTYHLTAKALALLINEQAADEMKVRMLQ